jgi:hypothetical protein
MQYIRILGGHAFCVHGVKCVLDYLTTYAVMPEIRLDQPIEHLQQRRFSGPIMPNQPQAFPPAEFKGHIPHSPKLARPKALSIFSTDFTD